jgi:uncharacterized protein involved in exopolysaccharide biosynthesis
LAEVDLWQTIRVFGRRWYVAVSVFLLALVVAGGVALTAKHQYESTGMVVLRQPSAGQVHGPNSGAPANPMLAFADSLTTDAQLVIQTLNSPAAIAEIAALGGTASYKATTGPGQGPFIMVTADSLTAGPTTLTVELVFRYAVQQLQQQERAVGAPPASYIILDNVVTPTPAALKAGGKSRFAGVAVILAFVASLSATYFADSYLRRRRARPAETARNSVAHAAADS